MIYINAPEGSGPCVKQTVRAYAVASDGRVFVGTNHCMTPQQTCPRADMPTGVGYELCKSVCNQPAHAEVNALQLAQDHGVYPCTLIVEGHTYACEPCKSAARMVGISRLVVAGKEHPIA